MTQYVLLSQEYRHSMEERGTRLYCCTAFWLYKGCERLMDWKIFVTIFASVFIAELGDKTQLATMLFASDKEVSKYTVFLAASAALVVASAIGVLAGSLLSEYINTRYLHYIAGIGFIGIGIFTLYNA